MKEQYKSTIILQLVELVDEQQALIGDLLKEDAFTPEIHEAVKRITLKFDNCKRDILLIIGDEATSRIECCQKYGKHNKKCAKLAKWIFTGDNQAYCGIHVRQFLKRALRPIFQPSQDTSFGWGERS